MTNTGSRIRSLREKRNWNQQELADKVGMNNSVLSRIENNKRPVASEELKKFAEVFGMSTDLLSGHNAEYISEGSMEFKEIVELSESESIEKIKSMFSYKGKEITEDQAKMIYYLSLGVVNKG